MILAGRKVLTPDGWLTPGWVRVEQETITDVCPGEAPDEADESAEWLVPGYIDLHVHGGGGSDYAGSESDLSSALAFHRQNGTTSTLISLVAAPIDLLCAQLARVADRAEVDDSVLGAHLEGPFLSSLRCGAQQPAHLLMPDLGVLDRLIDAGRGHLRSITLAPELPGADAMIERLVGAGVRVAVGHSDATYDQAQRAFRAGASLVTHLFNAMSALHHREPGVVGAALDSDAWCELVNDGVHLHPAVVRLVARVLPHRMLLVTDAISAAGTRDGDVLLGGQAVRVRDGQARLISGGALAGSTLTMAAAVRRAILETGLDPMLAFRAASTHPAAALGIEGDRGQIAVGRRADLLVLDEELRPQRVVVPTR